MTKKILGLAQSYKNHHHHQSLIPTKWGRLHGSHGAIVQMRVSMLNRFDILLRWLSKANTTLLLYPGLGPAIIIGVIFQMSQTFLLVIIFSSFMWY